MRPGHGLHRAGAACLALPLLLAAAACQESPAEQGQPAPACALQGGTVIWATDGDTLKLEVACRDDGPCGEGHCVAGFCEPDVTLRLMAVNAGEIPHGQGKDEPHECMGDDARLAVERLALDRAVELVYEPLAGCTEEYGRALAYAWVDGILLQERLVAQGLACLYWYKNEPDKEQTLYYERLAHAEERARRLGLGLWSPGGAACGGLPFPAGRCRR